MVAAAELFERHILEVRRGGWPVILRKAKNAGQDLLVLPLAVICVVMVRLARPWILIRIKGLSSRFGHMVANTELYLCERDAGINRPTQRHIDLFFFGQPVPNRHVSLMWRRVLRVWPSWLGRTVSRLNSVIPGGRIHEIGHNTQHDRDVLNLLSGSAPHLRLTAQEEERGAAALRAMGVLAGRPFVCLIVRDSRYLAAKHPFHDFSYHSYRDSRIQNYALAAEALADRGYYVIRMGALVEEPLRSSHPRVVDYATNGMRTDFMDVYLAAKCLFCLSTGTGFDTLPMVFRKPVGFVNLVPFGYLPSFLRDTVCLSKTHRLRPEANEMVISEIVHSGAALALFSSDFEALGIDLIENTPEEIRDVALEMLDRVNSQWRPEPGDEDRQHRFWELFPTDASNMSVGTPLHGKILARYSALYLRDHSEWLN